MRQSLIQYGLDDPHMQSIHGASINSKLPVTRQYGNMSLPEYEPQVGPNNVSGWLVRGVRRLPGLRTSSL